MVATPLTRWAATVAALMLAHQVAAKAVRDSFFLTVFPATNLPSMVMAAAAVSVASVPLYARLLARYGPNRVVTVGFLLSALAHLAEWAQPGPSPTVVVLIYLHLAALGALLLSGFWSLAAETFDPITARHSYGRIAAAGTLGGIAGGTMAERMAAWLPPSSPLLFLAALHIACFAALVFRPRTGDLDPEASDPKPEFALDALRRSPHLKPLALLVLLGTASAAILDYLFKSHAAAQLDGANLLRFFALFYVATQTLTFLAQTALTTRALVSGGAGGTVGALPLSVWAGSIGALFIPALPLFTIARGLEAVVRGSLFRSGYELIFSPMSPAEKRRAKTFLDVACDRAGDALGAGVVQVALMITPAFLVSELLGVVIVMSAIGLWIASRLNAFYARQVERRLVDRAGSIHGDIEVTGWASQPHVLSHASSTDITPPPTPAPARALDASMRLLMQLRSGNLTEVSRALTSGAAFETPHVAVAISLLAWDDVRDAAIAALVRTGSRHIGLLVDHLLDPDAEFAVRRRVPRVLARIPTQRSLDGLVAGLDDARFEVRYRCSRAIDQILIRDPSLTIDRTRIFAAVSRELAVPASVSTSYTVIDQDDASDPAASFDTEARARRNVDYVFSLLAAVLPRDPLKAAYRAVHSSDRLLRGLALDYLNGVLPEDLRPSFWAILDVDTKLIRPQVDPAQAASNLLGSQSVMEVRSSADDARGQSGPPPPATPRSKER